ncbi:hypothetical protein [Bradyrhizobium sp.]|uniref:hypothetical protein n=1 Tax=Bradyrhizobium sp. TaxID=376 RepID=UPI003C23483E
MGKPIDTAYAMDEPIEWGMSKIPVIDRKFRDRQGYPVEIIRILSRIVSSPAVP